MKKKNKTIVTVVYPVTFALEDAFAGCKDLLNLVKKAKEGKATEEEILNLKDQVLDIADDIYQSSSVNSLIHESDILELVD